MIAIIDYGAGNLHSVIARGNLVATQFYTEKCSDVGLRLYNNSIKIAVIDEMNSL